MREIKFRAWNGEGMEYGGFNIHATAGKIVPYTSLSRVKVGCPLMQFTGLKDKNGKDIYEGDVIKVTANPNHGKGLVKFGSYKLDNFTKHDRQQNHFGFYISFYDKDLSLIHSLVTPVGYGSSTHNGEVVGNIHENPELIKGD